MGSINEIKAPKVTVDKSEVDGVWVVFVDTDTNEEGSPTLRINLNDCPVYENPKFPEMHGSRGRSK